MDLSNLRVSEEPKVRVPQRISLVVAMHLEKERMP